MLQACFNNLFWTLNWATYNPPRVFNVSVTFLLTVICSLNTDSRKPDFSSEFILFSSGLCCARSCWFDVPALALLALSITLLLLGWIDCEMDLRDFEIRTCMLVVGLQFYKTQYVCLLMNSVCIVGGWWQLASLPSQTVFFLSFTKSVTDAFRLQLFDWRCLAISKTRSFCQVRSICILENWQCYLIGMEMFEHL